MAKETGTGLDQDAPITIFLMGIAPLANRGDWSLPDTQYRPYFLDCMAQANTLEVAGTQSAEPPGDEPPDVYLDDPLRPVPPQSGFPQEVQELLCGRHPNFRC